MATFMDGHSGFTVVTGDLLREVDLGPAELSRWCGARLRAQRPFAVGGDRQQDRAVRLQHHLVGNPGRPYRWTSSAWPERCTTARSVKRDLYPNGPWCVQRDPHG